MDALCSTPLCLGHALPLAVHLTGDPARSEAIRWLAVLLGLTVVGFIAIMVLRRWYRTTTKSDFNVGYTLHDLRRMRDEGQLSGEEFDRARDAMVTRLRRPRVVADDSESGATDIQSDWMDEAR